ncbi:MAG TPA: phage tail tip lysozyme, partial [Candidatus Saccharimonadales bacterium]
MVWVAVFAAIWITLVPSLPAFASTTPATSANQTCDPSLPNCLPDSEVQALNNWPNWEAETCSATNTDTNANTGNSSVTPGSIYIMGDSITALAKSTYQSTFGGKGWSPTINGLVSRQIQGGVSPDGLTALTNDKSTIGKANAIVIALGTNGVTNSAATTKSQVQQAMAKIKSYDTQNAPIFWVNVLDTNYDAASKTTNQAIKDGVGSDGTVIDWYSEAKSKADLPSFNGGVHPTKQADIDLLVNLVYTAVTSSTNGGGGGGGGGAASNGVAFDDSQSSDTGGQTTIDDDGVDPSPTNSPDHQSGTSYASGQLGALHTNYIALNPGWASTNRLTLGDVAVLTYKGKTVYAVYGDNHVGNTPHAEISVKAAMGLTGITDPAKVGSLTGVHFVVFPGTHTQLANSVDQSKIDQIGAAASGGGSPSSGSPSGAGGCCPSGASGNSGSGSGSATLTGSTPAEQAFNYFISPPANLSPQAAAGIVGNMMTESGGNTENLDTHAHNDISGTHDGIVQWSTSRWNALQSHESGKDIYALSTQLDYTLHELQHVSPYDSNTLPGLKSATSAAAAATTFNTYDEISGDSSGNREANATKIFGKYNGNPPGA